MNEKITLQDIVELLCLKHGMTKKNADALVRGMFDLIEEALSTEKYVKIKGLGTFKLTEVDSRESMNVNTGERIEIQGHTKISFTPDTVMKELINKPFSHFETVVLNEGVLLEDTPVVEEEPKQEDTADETPEVMVEQPEVLVEPKAETPEEVPVVEEPVLEVKVDEPETIALDSPDTVAEVVEEEVSTKEPVLEEPVQQQIREEEKVVEEEIKQIPEPVVATPAREHSKTTFRILIGIIIVLLLIILFGCYWMFFRSDKATNSQIPPAPIQEKTIETLIVEPAKVEEDTLQVGKDTLTVQTQLEEQPEVLSEDVVYEITGTITSLTLEPGQTLVRLALKYYGSKNFWPYIVQYNPDVIKDADVVPIGATIKIPKLQPKK